ncbi:MAG: hypothetical protein AABY46_02410 [Nitrospirota bacterium]
MSHEDRPWDPKGARLINRLQEIAGLRETDFSVWDTKNKRVCKLSELDTQPGDEIKAVPVQLDLLPKEDDE